MKKLFPGLVAVFLLWTCQTSQVPTVEKGTPFFQRVTSDESGIQFVNTLTEDRNVNSISFEGFLYGSGVAVIDIDNDGLQDLYFGAAQQPDKLFLNKGNFKFEDISDQAGIGIEKTWTNGVAIGDVNGDGFDDIYVCKGLYDQQELRHNLLYINQGNGYFKDEAAAYGVDDSGYSIMANFLDIDKDGDLDLYVGNQPPNSVYLKQQSQGRPDYKFTDRLYRNDGSRFTDITQQAGIANFNYTLSITVGDFNKDGWSDIYIASDFEEPDYFYVNQQNGTFKNKIHEEFRHLSNFSMGADVADINRDGWLDLFIADMAAEDNYRNKTNMSGMNPEKFWRLAKNGYHFQYMFNTLQLNNGNGSFSEIAQMSGISNTDWSWAPLFMDVDLDGNQDLFVSNGQVKDTRNKDFDKEKNKKIEELKATGMDGYDILFEVSKMVPQQKIRNYIYQNNGDLSFTKKISEWGLNEESWSQGAAYGDLDNDGDMDLVVNNLDMESFIYRNTAVNQTAGNFINIRLAGPSSNPHGLQSKVKIEADGITQFNEMNAIRGYMSSSEPVVQFGLGETTNIDEIEIEWWDGKKSIMRNVKPNQDLMVQYENAEQGASKSLSQRSQLFEKEKIDLVHIENDFDDYEREILIPHKMSTLGPAVAKADVNNDGLDDLYFGGSAGLEGQLMYQQTDGSFLQVSKITFTQDKEYEDTDAIFFDADSDGDLDLYVVSGGNEFPKGSDKYQDRLYMNLGEGNFSVAKLPATRESGGVVIPFDFDQDDDLDLFIGGRQVPGFYGRDASSILLENSNGAFQDVTSDKGKAFLSMGMVTDAVWGNFDDSGQNKLIVSGEWMPLQIFQFQNGTFEMVESPDAFKNSSGWWNCLKADDLDDDGDLDLIAGNLGLNIKFKASKEKPFKVYVNDFDDNGTHDVYLAYYDIDGNQFPIRGRQCSSEQMPFISEKFGSYNAFGKATVEEILEGRMDGATQKAVEVFESSVFINNGQMDFTWAPLPSEAQIAPIQDLIIGDYNGDSKKDIFIVGNYYNREVETIRSDAGIGYFLVGDGQGGFETVHPTHSGIYSYLDARVVLQLQTNQGEQILVANNNAQADIYRIIGQQVN